MNCVVCGGTMDPVLMPAVQHPTCGVNFIEPGDEDPFTEMLKDQLSVVIQAHQQRHPRGHQVRIGPSEIGDPCDRRIGYRIAGTTAVSRPRDVWPSTVGVAVHTWLQEAFDTWSAETNTQEWLTEKTLHIEDFVEGHSDLYSTHFQTVIDWKTMGPDVMRKTRKEGPDPGYVIQAQVYGYGYEQAGFPVSRVALACLPRAGWLKDMYLWVAPYERLVALNALNRLSGIATQILSLDILTESHGHRWEQVTATPSDRCGWCPMYDPNRDPDRGADEHGCPGR